MDPWKEYDFAKTPLKAAQVQNLPLEDLKLIRGFIFGRHGRVFKDAEIKDYWRPSRGSNQILTSTTRC
jgi:hypothetical protein